MRKITKRSHSAQFKFKVALAALKGEKTTSELCQEFGIVSSQLFKWRKDLLEQGDEVFNSQAKRMKGDEKQLEMLHATIGRLKVENDFLAKFAGRKK